LFSLDAIFVRPAVKLIPANTNDIVKFFEPYAPQWVEWIGATFIVVLESEAQAKRVFEEMTVAVRTPRRNALIVLQICRRM